MPIPKDYRSPIRMTAKEKAFNQLQCWIIDGTLEPGEKLYDAEIAEALGISRTPVREALQLLEVQGFVEMRRGRETKVTKVAKEDVLKLYPPLASLQALAAEEAVDAIQPEQIEKLQDLNQAYEHAIHSGQTFKAMEIDEAFHNLIVEIANNPYISDFTSILQLHIRRFKYIFLKQPLTSTSSSIQEHENLIRALQEKDKEKAASVMKQNWLRPMHEVYRLVLS
ncbi:transcriptional regulator, GntR family [Caldalkalibacillus thermarum TA2.A1]|uniref:GntR family transcriptional regulator n=1 Tax=Caldalkalibacillus thermarum (strain TA2.A1) TaxID=986075 RepID=F5L4A0_CALTT|nr:GntR family transcriptional regulator [Caldalkalibacillus thermarum]EGL83841.1 transcriptional regulator, GntR family [Caldalkalibacillus thermarum TA2.A1]QZT32484.1 GntR family transcriptional regulator [Caldalkalibacillus thermarum TA2.A1]